MGLFEVLSSPQPTDDPFWQGFVSNFQCFAKTEFAQPGIDAESGLGPVAHPLLFVAGVGYASIDATTKERQQMAKRLSREVLRLSLHGTLGPEKYPELDAYLREANTERAGSAKGGCCPSRTAA